MHFWQVVTLRLGGISWPVNHGFIGAMPELMMRSDLSLCGTSEKLPSLRHPFSSKKERNISRSSLTPYFFTLRPPFAVRRSVPPRPALIFRLRSRVRDKPSPETHRTNYSTRTRGTQGAVRRAQADPSAPVSADGLSSAIPRLSVVSRRSFTGRLPSETHSHRSASAAAVASASHRSFSRLPLCPRTQIHRIR